MAARKTLPTLTLALASAAAIAMGPLEAQAQSRYGQPAQANPQSPAAVSPTGRYGPAQQAPRKAYKPRKYNSVFDRFQDQRTAPYQTPHMPAGQFQQWVEWEPQYTLLPGDQLDIVVGSAPELSRTLTVGPDGRVVMPMSQPIMAAGRTFAQLQGSLMTELGKQLRDPRVSVTPRAYAPEQIYVGGQVGQPGTYTISNRIGALEAILMAGGMRTSAQGREVAILRRAPNGGMMLRTVNIRGGLLNIHEYNDTIQLRRGDIVFVPTSNIAEVGQFMQNFRNALPFDFNLSYQFGADGGNGTTVISP